MDVRNSSGNLVSILNGSHQSRQAPPPPPQLSHSRSNSSHSSSTSSPTFRLSQTPSLSRRDSSETTPTTISSSPITPTLSFNACVISPAKIPTGPLRPLIAPTSSFSIRVASDSMDHSSFPPTPQSALSDMQFSGGPNQPYFKQNPLPMTSFEHHGYPTTTAPKTSQKKNSYPCPVAKQYGCNEFFTTSGHAARHAKKHTGKKDAICPECSKAFTRKDNMEQHRRTHSGVRATAKSTTSSDESKTKRLKVQHQQKNAQTPPPRPAASPTNLPINVAPVAQMEMGMLDPRLMDTGMSFNASDVASILPTSFQQPLTPLGGIPRPSLHRSSYQESLQGRPQPSINTNGYTEQSSATSTKSPEVPSPSHAPALDALALAASRQ